MTALYFLYDLALFVKIIKRHHDNFYAEHFKVEKMIMIIC